MKKFLSIVILQLSFIGFSQASYLERCELTAEVAAIHAASTLNEGSTFGPGDDTTFTHLVSFKILESTNTGSHVESACQRHLDNEALVVVDPMQLAILQLNTKVKLTYFNVSGMSPDGIVGSERYTFDSVILEEETLN